MSQHLLANVRDVALWLHREREQRRRRVKLPSLVSAEHGEGKMQVHMVGLPPGPFLRKGGLFVPDEAVSKKKEQREE